MKWCNEDVRPLLHIFDCQFPHAFPVRILPTDHVLNGVLKTNEETTNMHTFVITIAYYPKMETGGLIG